MRCSGRKWSPTIPRSWRARPTSTRTGRRPTPSAGCRTAMWSIRVDSRGAGCSRRLHGAVLAARDRRSLSVHRVGRDARLEQRQGRHARHLLLRLEPVARGGQAPAASDRDHSVGGAQRLTTATSLYHGGILSEFQKRWAKTQVVAVQYGRGERAKKNPNTGEFDRRHHHPVGRGAGAESGGYLRGDQEAPAVRRLASRAHGRSVAR